MRPLFWNSKLLVCTLCGGEGGDWKTVLIVHSWKYWHFWMASYTFVNCIMLTSLKCVQPHSNIEYKCTLIIWKDVNVQTLKFLRGFISFKDDRSLHSKNDRLLKVSKTMYVCMELSHSLSSALKGSQDISILKSQLKTLLLIIWLTANWLMYSAFH